MKVLLLSCNTGEGHHSAALAVEAELQSRNIPCQLVDPMSFASDATRDRGFFDHTVRNLLPAKRAWFAALPTTDFLDTSRMSAEQAGAAVQAWVDRQLSLEQ